MDLGLGHPRLRLQGFRVLGVEEGFKGLGFRSLGVMVCVCLFLCLLFTITFAWAISTHHPVGKSSFSQDLDRGNWERN